VSSSRSLNLTIEVALFWLFLNYDRGGYSEVHEQQGLDGADI